MLADSECRKRKRKKLMSEKGEEKLNSSDQ
jgi:hypothetical protein